MTAPELAVQAYLRQGNSLDDLKQKYDIQSTVNPNLGIAVFNYRYLSPLELRLVRECRGLVVKLGTWDVVSKSIDAFFEPDDPRGKDITDAFDWTTAVAMDKLDGALLCLYFFEREWRVATRFSPDGTMPVTSVNGVTTQMNWVDLTKLTLKDMGYEWEDYAAKLDPDLYYTFEICTPENRVVVVYPTRTMRLVAVVGSDLLERSLSSIDWPTEKVEQIPVASMDDVDKLVAEHSEPYKYEGYVLLDGKFNRLKIRNPKFNNVMRTYSMDSEINVLKEVVAMDTGGTSPSSGNGSGGTCLRTDMMVRLLNGSEIPAVNVTVGEQLVGRFGRIQTVTHVSVHESSIVEIEHELGMMASSPSHGFFHADGERVFRAEVAEIGDPLCTESMGASHVISLQKGEPATVVWIECTPDHEFVASGLLVHNSIKTTTIHTDSMLKPRLLSEAAPADFVKEANANDIVARILLLCRWISDTWDTIKKLPEAERTQSPIYEIWPAAAKMLEEGFSMSDILGRQSEEDQVQALRRFTEHNAPR